MMEVQLDYIDTLKRVSMKQPDRRSRSNRELLGSFQMSWYETGESYAQGLCVGPLGHDDVT